MINPELSVIIPAYNEEERLPPFLSSVIEYMERSLYRYEVIVVDDGSDDTTSSIVTGMTSGCDNLSLVRLERNSGKGEAVRVGMLHARGERRLFVDADGATPIAEVERLMKVMDAGFDVVIGSRACKDDECTVRYKIHRKIMGTIFNLVVRLMLGLKSSDTQCGFKLMTAAAANAVCRLQVLKGFGFDIEILYLARKLGFNQAETAVNWRDVKGSKVALIKDSARMFSDVIKVRYFDLTGRYATPARGFNSPNYGSTPDNTGN